MADPNSSSPPHAEPKWLITQDAAFNDVEREQYWSRIHNEQDYANVWSMTEHQSVRDKIVGSLRPEPQMQEILIPGCGSRGVLEVDLAQRLPDVRQVVGTDFEPVVQTAAARTNHPNVTHVARNTQDLGWHEKFDAAVIVNSIVSEDDRENRQMLRSCAQALRPGGLLVGFFPTVFANLDIGHLDENAEWLRRSDLPTNTFYEAAHDATQIFYTPLRLRRVLMESNLTLETMEIFFCDDEKFLEQGQQYYGLSDPDLVVYEHFVVARRNP